MRLAQLNCVLLSALLFTYLLFTLTNTRRLKAWERDIHSRSHPSDQFSITQKEPRSVVPLNSPQPSPPITAQQAIQQTQQKPTKPKRRPPKRPKSAVSTPSPTPLETTPDDDRPIFDPNYVAAMKIRIHENIERIMREYREKGGKAGIERPVRVLFHDSFWGNQIEPHQTFTPCPVRCEYFTGNNRMPEADAVVYHLPNFGGFPPNRDHPGQKWIALQFEPENIHAKLKDPAIMQHMDATMTYSVSSTVPVPYWTDYVFADPLFSAPVEFDTKRRDGLAIFMQYACSTPTRREDYVRDLMKVLPVHSYGPCLNNRQDPRSSANPASLTREYMFSIVMENGHLPTYVTDKLYRAFQGATIPLYRGAPDITAYIPHPDAVIRIDDFESPAALASYLKEVSTNRTLWEKHVAWRNQPGRITEAFYRLARFQYIHSQCRVCMYAATGEDPLSSHPNEEIWKQPLRPTKKRIDTSLWNKLESRGY